MSVLTARGRHRMARGQFALPRNKNTPKGVKGRYPIHDRRHARAALQRASQHLSRADYLKVARAVHRKYPTMKVAALSKRKKK